MGQSGLVGGGERVGEVGCLGGQDVDAFVEVGVGGALADVVVGGELAYPGAVQEPAQYQDGLPERAQCAPPGLLVWT